MGTWTKPGLPKMTRGSSSQAAADSSTWLQALIFETLFVQVLAGGASDAQPICISGSRDRGRFLPLRTIESPAAAHPARSGSASEFQFMLEGSPPDHTLGTPRVLHRLAFNEAPDPLAQRSATCFVLVESICSKQPVVGAGNDVGAEVGYLGSDAV